MPSHKFGLLSRNLFTSILVPPCDPAQPFIIVQVHQDKPPGRKEPGGAQSSRVLQSITGDKARCVAISNNPEPASARVAGSGQLSSARRQGRGGGVSQTPGRGSGREHTFMEWARPCARLFACYLKEPSQGPAPFKDKEAEAQRD